MLNIKQWLFRFTIPCHLFRHSIDDEENDEGLFCMAAPVYGAVNSIQAAISVAGPKERMIKQRDAIIEKLLLTSKEVSASIGFKVGQGQP